MDIVGKWRWFFLLSALIVVPGVVSLLIPPRLYLGIEFTSGSTVNVDFESPVAEDKVRGAMNSLEHPEAIIQGTGDKGYFVRLDTLEESTEPGQPSERERVHEALTGLAPITRFDTATVSPVIARDTVTNAFIAVSAASIAILFYVTWSFRRVPKPFRYGVAAIAALVHDVVLVLGVYSILGKAISLEVNAMFIPAILTVIGYSVNDTIVVFDRIRENVARAPELPLRYVVNQSILQTLGRSLNTSITTLVVILALLLLGGESIRNFLIILFIGIVSGSYSSIGIASQLLVVWETGEAGRALRRLPLVPSRA